MNNVVRLSFICSRALFYTLKQPLCMTLPSRILQMHEWLQDLATAIVFRKNQNRPQMSSAAIQQKSKQKQHSHVALLGHILFTMYYATGISCLATRRDGFLHSDWQPWAPSFLLILTATKWLESVSKTKNQDSVLENPATGKKSVMFLLKPTKIPRKRRLVMRLLRH